MLGGRSAERLRNRWGGHARAGQGKVAAHHSLAALELPIGKPTQGWCGFYILNEGLTAVVVVHGLLEILVPQAWSTNKTP